MRAYAMWERVLDLLFPPKRRTLRVRALSLEQLPVAPHTELRSPLPIETLMPYRSKEVQALIHALKYDRDHYAAQLLAQLLAEHLLAKLSEHHTFSHHRILVVPVPLSPQRQHERGYNQIMRVLAHMPTLLPEVTIAQALVRTRHTRPQTKLSRKARLENVAGAFALVDSTTDFSNTTIYLVDDVATTGATLTHAAAPLEAAGAEVVAMALARA